MCNDRPEYAQTEVAKIPARPAHAVVDELAHEHRELCVKIDRLRNFLEAGAPGVSPKQVEYLRDQHGFMTGYAKCLNLRMKDLLDSICESSDSE